MDTSSQECLFHARKGSRNGHELSKLDNCLLWITLAATLVYRQWSNYNIAGVISDKFLLRTFDVDTFCVVQEQTSQTACSLCLKVLVPGPVLDM